MSSYLGSKVKNLKLFNYIYKWNYGNICRLTNHSVIETNQNEISVWNF